MASVTKTEQIKNFLGPLALKRDISELVEKGTLIIKLSDPIFGEQTCSITLLALEDSAGEISDVFTAIHGIHAFYATRFSGDLESRTYEVLDAGGSQDRFSLTVTKPETLNSITELAFYGRRKQTEADLSSLPFDFVIPDEHKAMVKKFCKDCPQILPETLRDQIFEPDEL